MTETTGTETTTGTAAEAGAGTGTETTYTPPATQADLDRIIAERLNRQKAAFKDFDAFKKKAEQFDQLTEAQKTELERAQGELTRWQTEAETWRGKTIASTVRALAATDFADPDDAVRNLDPSKYLDAGGVIDEAGIKADLAGLLEAKPHYRRGDGTNGVRAPAPNRAQGSSATSTATSADPAQQFAAFLGGQLNQQ